MKQKRYWNEVLDSWDIVSRKVPSVNPHAEPNSLGIEYLCKEGRGFRRSNNGRAVESTVG